MAIPFVPSRGEILICDFDMARVPPEMPKARRAVVMSPRSYNARHGFGPGRCVVVPLSASPPRSLSPAYVSFPPGIYRTLTVPTWAICDCVMAVSHTRLDRVRVSGEGIEERMTAVDMIRVEVGLRHALGIVER